MKWMKAIIIFLIGIGIINVGLNVGIISVGLNTLTKDDFMFFFSWVIVFPFLNWVLLKLGKRFFPTQRQYPLSLSMSLMVIASLLDYWLFIMVLPKGYVWLSVIILALAFAVIDTFFPKRQIKKKQ